MTEQYKPGYLLYQHGTAEDKLNEAFSGDYQRAFREHVNIYCQMHEHAGPQSAAFVEALPHDADRVCEAMIGWITLQHTRMALEEILENDRQMREAVIGEEMTDDCTDRAIRSESEEFNRRYNLHRQEEILQSAREDMLSDRQYADIAYGGDAEEIEDSIARSCRNEMDGLGDAHMELHVDGNGKPLPEGRPRTRWAIKIPDLAGQPPVACFQIATQWSTRGIIDVSTGSAAADEQPRLSPLTTLEDTEYGVQAATVRAIIGDIYEKVMRLQPPLPDHPDEFEFTVMQLATADPHIAIHSIDYMLHKFFPADATELMRIFRGVDPDNPQQFMAALLNLLERARGL